MVNEHNVLKGKGQVKHLLQNNAGHCEKVYYDYVFFSGQMIFPKYTLFQVFSDAKKNHCCS